MSELMKKCHKSGDKAGFNTELVKMFNRNDRDLDLTCKELAELDITLNRKQVIGKLSYMGERDIVPKKEAVKKDNGPTKKELVADFCRFVGLKPYDITSFANCKKSDITAIHEAVLAIAKTEN